MSRGLVQPLFPNAPSDYNSEYMSEVVRAFSVFLQQVNNPGGIFQYGDELRITVANKPYLRGSQAAGAVGNVTVTIT